ARQHCSSADHTCDFGGCRSCGSRCKHQPARGVPKVLGALCQSTQRRLLLQCMHNREE
ncbi:unnamed protein product, partial [Durusdinium trenchii]